MSTGKFHSIFLYLKRFLLTPNDFDSVIVSDFFGGRRFCFVDDRRGLRVRWGLLIVVSWKRAERMLNLSCVKRVPRLLDWSLHSSKFELVFSQDTTRAVFWVFKLSRIKTPESSFIPEFCRGRQSVDHWGKTSHRAECSSLVLDFLRKEKSHPFSLKIFYYSRPRSYNVKILWFRGVSLLRNLLYLQDKVYSTRPLGGHPDEFCSPPWDLTIWRWKRFIQNFILSTPRFSAYSKICAQKEQHWTKFLKSSKSLGLLCNWSLFLFYWIDIL